MKFINRLPLIHYVLTRAKNIPEIGGVVMATTDRAIDDVLANYALDQGVQIYRGSTDDVAGRMVKAALQVDATHLIRINGDSVFIDPLLIAQGISRCRKDVDFVTNLIGRTFPYGISVEILKTTSYQRAYAAMKDGREREHVTSYIYSNAQKFEIISFSSDFPELSRARLVVDTYEDLNLFKEMVSRLGDAVFTVGYKEVAELYLKLTDKL